MSRSIRNLTLTAAALSSLAVCARGDGVQVVFTCDPTLDRVFIHHDDVLVDGTYNQAGETAAVYRDDLGSIPLTEPVCLTASPDDTIYVGDAVEDIILALNDANENDDATEPGEHWVFFDGKPGGNASGVTMQRVTGLTVKSGQIVWASVAGDGAGGGDQILRLEDLNADGDANDAGEAVVYYSIPPLGVGATAGDFVPAAVEIGNDLHVYYLEDSTTGARARGVYRLDDLDANGVIDPVLEVSPYFLPGPLGATPQLVALEQDTISNWYVLDRSAARVWRGTDVDTSGTIDVTEMIAHWTLPGGTNSWDIAVFHTGQVYALDDGAPDRFLVGEDLDGSQQIENPELVEAYSDLLCPVDIAFPRGIAVDFHAHGDIGTQFCFGQSGCPCGNDSAAAPEGCVNSTGVGAILGAVGSTGVGNNDAEFVGSQLPPNKPALLLQSTQSQPLALPFYDGLLCISGPVKRLGAQLPDAAGTAEWGPGLAQAGGWQVGTTYYFQVWHRDSGQSPCGQRANTTNAVAVTFDP